MTLLAAVILVVVIVAAVTLRTRPMETPVHQRDDTLARPFD